VKHFHQSFIHYIGNSTSEESLLMFWKQQNLLSCSFVIRQTFTQRTNAVP